MFGDVWSLIGMLAAAALILALAYLFTRYVAGRGGTGVTGARASRELCVLCQISLGRGERLVLIRLHERCLLLGVTSGNIRMLAELTQEEAGLWLEQPDRAAQTVRFMDVLHERISKKK